MQIVISCRPTGSRSLLLLLLLRRLLRTPRSAARFLFGRNGARGRVSAYRFHYGHLRRSSQIKPIISYPPSPTSSQTLSAAREPGLPAETILLANQPFHPRKYRPKSAVLRLRGATYHPPFGNLRNHFGPSIMALPTFDLLLFRHRCDMWASRVYVSVVSV